MRTKSLGVSRIGKDHGQNCADRGYPLYGKGKGLYRIIFHIREEDQHVRVLRIWHASRDAITAADVED